MAVDLYPPSVQSGTSAWTQLVNESGASLTNFTAINGTWTVSGGTVLQGVGGGNAFLRLNDQGIPTASVAVEFDAKLVSGSGADQRLGIAFSNPALSTGTPFYYLKYNGSAWTWVVESYASAVVLSGTPAGAALNTWMNFRFLVAGNTVSWWLDGTFLVTVAVANHWQPSLAAMATTSQFRNYKIWTPTIPW